MTIHAPPPPSLSLYIYAGEYVIVIGDADDGGAGAKVVDALEVIGGGKAKGNIKLKALCVKCGAKMSTDTMVFERLNPKFRYETQVLKLDSKTFGLPQTRQVS